MMTRPDNGQILILCVDISHLSRQVQFAVLSSLVFFCYLIYGYFQELIFQAVEFRPYGWYLTLVQFACYIVLSFVERHITDHSERRMPLSAYAGLAGLTVATMGFSNSSVGYLNYPTQVIFKSCKLIPVLLGGIIIQSKVYGLLDYTACVCMSVGLILFNLADSSVSPNFNTYGILLICLALCADAVIGNVQEKNMKLYDSSNIEMVFYSYAIGFLYILIGVVVTGEIAPAFKYCYKNLITTYVYAICMSLSGYFGVSMVLHLVSHFGALLAVTVTTCRKAVTIVLSFVFFSKPFTIRYIWAGSVVLLGIYLHVLSKRGFQLGVFLQRCRENILSVFGKDSERRPTLHEIV